MIVTTKTADDISPLVDETNEKSDGSRPNSSSDQSPDQSQTLNGHSHHTNGQLKEPANDTHSLGGQPDTTGQTDSLANQPKIVEPEPDNTQQPPPSLRSIPAVSNKRRSSWRYLLSPSYKSRSEEFHKLFADELPKGERLIADYSCALHREILLQGRLYVSINYLAFYSNIFSWITKLVVRLSDISDIQKANTAKIIPNAIQIITEQGDKHVFASFIARDKSYLMIWRIWRNSNLIKERLSDQEIRRLVHLSYGKDLGLNDQEEQKISGQPMARTSPNSSLESQPDDENNNKNSKHDIVESQLRSAKQKPPVRLRFKSRSQNQKEVLSLIEEGQSGEDGGLAIKSAPKAHKRNRSVDLGRTLALAGALTANTTATTQKKKKNNLAERTPQKKAPRKGKQTDRVVRHLSMRLANLSSLSYHDDDDDEGDEDGAEGVDHPEVAANTNNESPISAASPKLHNESGASESSAVIVDTPVVSAIATEEVLAASPAKELKETELESHQLANEQNDPMESAQQGQEQTLATSNESDEAAESLRKRQAGACPMPAESEAKKIEQTDGSTTTTTAESNNGSGTADGSELSQHTEQQVASSLPEAAALASETVDLEPMVGGGEDLEQTGCGCTEHEGVPIADEQFDIGVDVLFSLIFTNSKFMRAHMTRRGMTSASVSKWRRGGRLAHDDGPTSSEAPTTSGDKSNSSTLSRDSYSSEQQQHQRRQNSLDSLRVLNHRAGKVRSEQERQLNYSMNVNHVLAKQIQVEERQNIRLARPAQVYVLKSQTINSGFPCSESFTIDLTYCLTRCGSNGRSRMLVHGLVNFIKEKHSWRLSMIKSVIEKSSMEGIKDFISDLTVGIRAYVQSKQSADTITGLSIDKTTNKSPTLAGRQQAGDDHDDRDEEHLDRATPVAVGSQRGARGSRSLARVKSKLKERKLRTMYKYYIQTAHLSYDETSSLKAREEGVGSTSSNSNRRRQNKRRSQDLFESCSRSSSDTCSSMMSSPASSICDDTHDNDSMVMMMTTTNDEDEDQHHHNQHRHHHHQTNDEHRPSHAPNRNHNLHSNNQNHHLHHQMTDKVRATTTTNTLGLSSTPSRAGSPIVYKNESGALATFERRLTSKNLIPLTIIGLLLVLVVVVLIVNALILRRLEQVESALQMVLSGCENGTTTTRLLRLRQQTQSN